MAIQQASISRGGLATRAPRPSNLAEVLDLILDKGIVIDAYVRVSVVGIEVLTVDLRVVVASVDTYLRFAEAVNRLDLEQVANNLTLEDLQNKETRSAGEHKGKQALEKAKDRVTPGKGDSADDGSEEGVGQRARGAAEKVKERVRPGGRDGEDEEDGPGNRSRGERSRRREDDGNDENDDDNNGGVRGLVSKVAQRARWNS